MDRRICDDELREILLSVDLRSLMQQEPRLVIAINACDLRASDCSVSKKCTANLKDSGVLLRASIKFKISSLSSSESSVSINFLDHTINSH